MLLVTSGWQPSVLPPGSTFVPLLRRLVIIVSPELCNFVAEVMKSGQSPGLEKSLLYGRKRNICVVFERKINNIVA